MTTLHQTQLATAAGIAAVGLGYGVVAMGITGEAGYGGVGPNFLPFVVAAVLLVCGVMLGLQALKGGWAAGEDAAQTPPELGAGLMPDDHQAPSWTGFAYVSAGLLGNALLLTTLGFILSCGLCFALAAKGFRVATNKPDDGFKTRLRDFCIGTAIAAPVFWMFTKLLQVNLPGLTASGWI